MIFLMMIDTPEDKGKFAILYEKYRYLMQKVAADVLNDRFLAEDAVHNAFISLAAHMDKIENPDSLQTKRYLITITKNAAVDIYRKKHWFSITYTDEDGNMITWDQFLIQDGQELIADTEYDRQIIREINGSNAVISLYLEGDGFAYYEYGECVYVLTFDNLDIDDICFALDSIADKQ